jgi:hypothetical protein
MVKKKYRIVSGKLWRPIPGSPALYGKVGSDLSNPKNRKGDMQLDWLRDRKRKRRGKK